MTRRTLSNLHDFISLSFAWLVNRTVYTSDLLIILIIKEMTMARTHSVKAFYNDNK